MDYYLIGTEDGKVYIYGMGNTDRTANAAGRRRAEEYGAMFIRVVTKLPEGAVWFNKEN